LHHMLIYILHRSFDMIERFAFAGHSYDKM
jgi:hypothetical protein